MANKGKKNHRHGTREPKNGNSKAKRQSLTAIAGLRPTCCTWGKIAIMSGAAPAAG